MRKAVRTARAVLADLARLRLPVTAAAAATTLVGLTAPFGVDLSQQTMRITAALTAIGLAASAISKWADS
jgi:hypothetical protein